MSSHIYHFLPCSLQTSNIELLRVLWIHQTLCRHLAFMHALPGTASPCVQSKCIHSLSLSSNATSLRRLPELQAGCRATSLVISLELLDISLKESLYCLMTHFFHLHLNFMREGTMSYYFLSPASWIVPNIEAQCTWLNEWMNET